MALFLCVLAFSSAAAFRAWGSLGRDAVVWRPRLRQAPAVEPLYREPSPQTIDHILQALESTATAPSPDDFGIRLPLSLLFDDEEHLSSSGMHLLRALSSNLHGGRWDLQFQVGDAADAPQAVKLCHFLVSEENWQPARLAVGVQSGQAARDFVWLVLLRQY